MTSKRLHMSWISQAMMRERTSGPYENYGEMLYAESLEGIARRRQKVRANATASAEGAGGGGFEGMDCAPKCWSSATERTDHIAPVLPAALVHVPAPRLQRTCFIFK